MQWADGPSLKMIEHVLRHELTSRTMVLATARSPADDPTPELDRVAAASPATGTFTRVTVGGLASDEVGELLRCTGATPPTPSSCTPPPAAMRSSSPS